MTKKRIVYLFSFIFIIILLDCVIGSALEYFYFKETSGLHFRTTYSIDSTEAETIIFGASRANHHYVPEVFEETLNMSYYNTGRNGTGILYQLAVLKSVLKRHKPKLIILDFYEGFDYNPASYERLSSISPYYRKNEDVKEIVNLKGPYEKFKMFSRIYPYNSQLLTIAIGNMKFNKKRKKDIKGYIALNGKWKKSLDTITYKPYELDSVKIMAFKEFVALAKESGSAVAVVYSPIFRYENDDMIKLKICRNVCYENEIQFISFSNNEFFLSNKEMFQDISHLNHSGATIFSEILVKKLNSH